MTKIFIFLLPLIITFSQTFPATGADHNPTFLKSVKRNPMKLRTEKLSHFQFYWHDIISGPNPTVVNIIQPPKTNKTTPTGFGMVNMIDDPLTEKPETGSQLLGRAQGFYGVASQGELGLLMAMNFVFLTGKYNGSTLTVLGRNPVFHKVREMPVIGGSGLFRFARGYVQASTHSFDLKTGFFTYMLLLFDQKKMGEGDQPLILTNCSLEETANLLSPVVREEQPEPLDVDNFGILTDDSPLRYIGFDQQGYHSSLVYQTPNGSRYWCPDVSSDFKPVVGKIYLSWDEVYKMYETYGEMSGFQIRVAGYKKWKGEITHRVLVCNKAGKPRGKMIDSVHPASMFGARSSCFKVTGCKTLIRLRGIKGTTNYELYEFSENHNHELVSSENMDLTRKGKHLNFDDLHFVHAMSLNRVGATVAHRLQTSLKGGHHNMRGTRNSYKNVSRDIRMFIGERDVQLVLKKLEDRAKNLHNFSFEVYHFEGVLQAIFWADDVSKLSYQLFGDVIAFDATYSTNKYNMIFVPFTGVDNHKRCVTFGAGLIHNETVESYSWLLEAFLKIHVKHPRLVLSDQDPAMRIAVPNVFTKSMHRLCMWHIMKKLPSKVSGDLINNSNIRSRLHKLVWNVYISTATFEEKWHNLMAEYALGNHIWLNEMFSIRELWVPCYFRDIPMCCLMKTTSRCESSNSMFKVTSGSTNTLVQFLMCFDTAIDNQRYNQRLVDFKSKSTTCVFKTGLELEVHAAKIYTQTIFKDVQKEIYKCMINCFITNVDLVENFKVFTVSHMDNRSDFVNHFKVSVHMLEHSYECSCMGFTRVGYLCRHIFCVFRLHQIKNIPDRYISNRWRKLSLPSRVYSISQRLSVDNSEVSVLRNEVADCLNECVDHLAFNVDGLSSFHQKMKDLKRELVDNFPASSTSKKKQCVIEHLVGQHDDETIDLLPPHGIRNKGCGTNRRLVGPGEKAIENSKKNPRMCRSCNQLTFHDSRNCKKKPGVGESTSEK